jgi:RNA polymerase sigma-70 factor (ECF subfamily)
VLRLQQELKPEYAEALQQVEIDQTPVKEFAQATGISATNAGVRVHRAREALRRRVLATCGACAAGGCTDCNCVSDAQPSEPR